VVVPVVINCIARLFDCGVAI